MLPNMQTSGLTTAGVLPCTDTQRPHLTRGKIKTKIFYIRFVFLNREITLLSVYFASKKRALAETGRWLVHHGC